ncbi:MAG TPA: hypothetical protein VME70_12230 [Mycobacteriales bacterium]|nr:hypothetical protein [Mycobacteriales bacterium]
MIVKQPVALIGLALLATVSNAGAAAAVRASPAQAAVAAGHYHYSRVHVPSVHDPHRLAAVVAGLTSSGDVVGSVSGPGPNASRTFIKAPGDHLTWVKVPGYPSIQVDAVSPGGELLVSAFNPKGHGAPRLYLRTPDGTLRRVRVPKLNPSSVIASGVNDNGEVVGSGFTMSGRPRSFAGPPGAVHLLSLSIKKATAIFASGVNDNGVIVGSYADRHDVTYGFVDRAGNVHSIRLPRAGTSLGRGSAIVAVADNGSWVGTATTGSAAAATIVYLHVPGHRLVRLRYPKARAQTEVNFVNSDGVVTGTFGRPGKPTTGFLARPLG